MSVKQEVPMREINSMCKYEGPDENITGVVFVCSGKFIHIIVIFGIWYFLKRCQIS
jgi:hypothetical protein